MRVRIQEANMLLDPYPKHCCYLLVLPPLYRNRVFDKIKELVDELCELHKREIQKLQNSQELDSHHFQSRQLS
jgi:hypothetical protein